jgi:AraC-like DNA-binding protein
MHSPSEKLNIALLIPVIIPFIIALILFFSSGKSNRPKLFLSLSMFNTAFVFWGNYLYFNHAYYHYSFIHGFHIFSVLAIYPSFYIYFLLLTQQKIRWKKYFLHFLPALLFMLVSDVIFFPFLNISERVYFLGEYRIHPTFDNLPLSILWIFRFLNVGAILVQVVLYSLAIFRLQKQHKTNIQECFSNPWEFDLNWIRVLNFILIASAIVSILFYTTNPVKLLGEQYITYPFYLLSGVISLLGILGNMQNPVLKNITDGQVVNLNDLKGNELKLKLENYFIEKQPYLQPDLKLTDVCAQIGSNRTYVSNLINVNYGMNFSQFVNHYRLKEAEELLRKFPTRNLEQVAVEAGFGHISSFSRACKMVKKISLGEFRKNAVLSN